MKKRPRNTRKQPTRKKRPTPDLTINTVIQSLGFRDWLNNGQPELSLFSWPPDVFAMAATILRESGAYLQAARSRTYPSDDAFSYKLTNWTRDDDPPDSPKGHVGQIAREWRSQAEAPSAIGDLLRHVAKIATDNRTLWEVSRPDADNLDWYPFLQLLCIADLACRGVGLLFPHALAKDIQRRYRDKIAVAEALCTYPFDSYVCTRAMGMLRAQTKENQRLSAKGQRPFFPSTLCDVVFPSRAIVLPKMRTSQRGVTIRSFSHHLALLNGTDVEPRWHYSGNILLSNAKRQTAMKNLDFTSKRLDIAFESPDIANNKHTKIDPANKRKCLRLDDVAREAGPYNLVLLPWPFELRPSQFEPMDGPFECLAQRPPDGDKLFRFRAESLGMRMAAFKNQIRRLCNDAESKVGPIHGLVLPEMALTKSDFFKVFDQKFLKELEFVACGVYDPPSKSKKRPLGDNYVVIRRLYSILEKRKPPSYYAIQYKHHRWALDKNQISMYRLGSAFRSDTTWWEGIDLPRRELHFFVLDAFTVFTVLVCEDLARPDPVADTVRAVGPNLVICLLLDGPQLATRWSARYATVLGDDPGSSVLTLSSLGMVNLCRIREQLHQESRVIGLWRDSSGPITELHLPPGYQGLVLSLSSHSTVERTIDGRHDSGMGGTIHLTGVHPIKWSSTTRT